MTEQDIFFLESEIGRMVEQQCRYRVIPVPFEASVSYAGGTAAGPEAILEASQQLELYDGFSYPGEMGIFTQAAIDCSPPASGNHDDKSVDAILEELGSRVRRALEEKAIPVVLGGEHSISYAGVMAARELFGEQLGVVQLDAHGDLRLAYQGKLWSHASVMRRLSDLGVPILQLGVRGICREELLYRENQTNLWYYDASELVPQGIQEIHLPDDFPPYLYLTLDVDGLDPSIMPATGTPVPGGLSWYQSLNLIASVARQRQIIAFDCVELAPQRGLHSADFTAAQLVYNCMGIIERESPDWSPEISRS